MNKFVINSITITNDKQSRIDEAERFFNLLYGAVTERKYGYLWAKRVDERITYPFDVSNPAERKAMAVKAIELNDQGADVYYGINLMDTPPAPHERATKETVTLQTAIGTDIDCEGGTHISSDKKKYPTFDIARSLLPFTPSTLINSGYGYHGLYLYSEPMPITADNRKLTEQRNRKFIDVIRNRGGIYAKAVDGVGDLPRVLRVPGTFNYKLGRDNAPLCHIVEVNDVRFTPTDMDKKLDALKPVQSPIKPPTPARKPDKFEELGNDYDLFRAQLMLEAINPIDLSDTDWLAVISSCKNIGVPYPSIDAFNLRDLDRYNELDNQSRWDSLSDPSFDIETLHGIAKQFGYQEGDARRQWYQLHPELSNKKSHDHRADSKPVDLNHTGNSFTHDDDNTGNTPDETFIWTKDKIKSCPVNLRVPEDFIFSQGGMYQIVETKTKTKYIPVTKTPIVPTKIFYDPIKKIDVYEIAILSRGKWRHVEVDARTLGDARALNMLCDYGALILDNGRLKVFLAEIIALNPDMQEVKAYSQTGWIDDTFTTFAYPGNDDCIIRRAGFDFDKALATRGDAQLWKQKFIEVLEKGGAVAHAYIGTALSSIIARPLNIMNPQAHLLGTSGGGKTALQKFAASIFGNPRELMRNFAATNKNRQLVAAAFCDLPSFYDELETIQGKAAEENLSNDVYNFADGKGNQANKRDGTARETFRFGGARLTTGERPILKQRDQRGAYKRLMQYHIHEKLFDDEFAADLHIFSESNFGHFALQWIQFAQAHMKEIQAAYQHWAKSDPTTRKYEPTHLKTLAASLVAVEFFKVMLGVNSEYDAVSLVRNKRSILDNQLPTIDQMDDTTRAIEFLKSFVAGNDRAFAHEVDKPDFNNEFTQQTPECIGKMFKNSEVAFLPHAFTEILEKRGGFASADKLREEFCAKGYLRHSLGNTTYPTYFGDKYVRMIRFKPDIITSAEQTKLEDDRATK